MNPQHLALPIRWTNPGIGKGGDAGDDVSDPLSDRRIPRRRRLTGIPTSDRSPAGAAAGGPTHTGQ
jgi:hypothetical protein